jgi:hypothetical protein
MAIPPLKDREISEDGWSLNKGAQRGNPKRN